MGNWSILALGALILLGIVFQIMQFIKAIDTHNESFLKIYWPYYVIGLVIFFGVNSVKIFEMADKSNFDWNYPLFALKSLAFLVVFIVKGIFSTLICFVILAYELFAFINHGTFEKIPILQTILSLVLPGVSEHLANIYTIGFVVTGIIWNGFQSFFEL